MCSSRYVLPYSIPLRVRSVSTVESMSKSNAVQGAQRSAAGLGVNIKDPKVISQQSSKRFNTGQFLGRPR